jgi:beta-carotene 3-hydroxylase
MHGVLWKLHVDHHRKDKINNELPFNTENRKFEKNDLFFLVYAIPAIIFIVTGFSIGIHELVSFGFGITLFGFSYLIVHDIIIHKRFNIPFLIRLNGKYLRALIRAHTAHHHPKSKSDFTNFGLFVFPMRFYTE